MEDTKQTQAAGPQKGNAAWDKVKAYGRLYFVDAMSAMAQGLFASLLIGTIISTLGSQLNMPCSRRSATSPNPWQDPPWPWPSATP